MLQKLLIQNFALIDHLQIRFEDGFSVITGETGSGKSILLGALGQILGDRFDHTSIRDKEKKCVIEGSFIVSEKDHKKYFNRFDLDFESETIIRREITTSGKSRAFINDTPVSLSTLKEISNLLVDIHSQHETLMINNPQFVLELMDSQLKNQKQLTSYQDQYNEYVKKTKTLETLEEQEANAQNQKDFTAFLIRELEEYNLAELIENDLDAEFQLLTNAEDIKRKIDRSTALLNGSERNDGALSALKQAQVELSTLSGFGKPFEELSERVASSLIELQDIADDCERLSDKTELDEQRLQELEQIMSFINRMLHKHQLSDTQELLSKYRQLQEELSGIDNLSEEIAILQKEVKLLEKDLKEMALSISADRKTIANQLQADAGNLLMEMNMKNAEIDFRFEPLSALSRNGIDNVNIYVKTNMGGSFEPLKKVASGGETSRIMLAIKSLQSRSRSLPTIIFDEIDTGVSGEVANRMGNIMATLGEKMQVISITHLPQIAAKGSTHYKVFKQEQNGQTLTHIQQLGKEERLSEIAELLSGSDVTSAALKNAQELLKTK